MTQLSLLAALTRWEIPTGYWSWRDGDTVIRVTQGAYCIDLSWKFFKPWRPWDASTCHTSADQRCNLPDSDSDR